MKGFFSKAGALMGATVLTAQASVIPLPPVIRMNVDDADKGSIRLSELSVSVEIVGNVATTTLDMIFANSSSRILEGELEFPLAEGQTVCGYALDINGRLRQGVVVEKEKGRTVFEDIVRRNVDPGLVEMTLGNNFKTRVYPLPAKGTRHVQISYEETLKPSEGGVRRYALPVLTNELLDSFDFKINVVNADKTADLRDGDDLLLHSGYTGNFSKKNWRLEKPIQVTVQAGTSPDSKGSVFTQEKGRDTYFYYSAPVTAAARTKALPQKLVLFYDISSSMAARNFQAEIDFLRTYTEHLNKPELLVVPFCNEIHEARSFSLTGKKAFDELTEFLKNQNYDGATNLDYDFATMFPCDEVLIFSDGLSNWKNPDSAEDSKKASIKKAPVVNTVSSVAGADFARLQSVAQSGGGVFVNLYTKTAEQGAQLLLNEALRLISVEYDKAAVEEVYPLEGSPVTDEFSLSGILKRKNATIRLKFGYGNSVIQEMELVVSSVGERNSVQPQNIARLWAEKKLDCLNSDYTRNKAEIIETAKKFGIVTKDTSLIVLDSVHDYVRYGIEPPQELKAEYDRLTAGNRPTAKPADSEKIPDSVFRVFDEFRKWWNTKPDAFKKQAKKEKGGRIRLFNSAATEGVEADGVYYADSLEEEVVGMAAPQLQMSDAAAVNNVMRMERAAAPQAAMAKGAGGSEGAGGASITIQAWSPDAEYLSVLKRTPLEKMYEKYLELKRSYSDSPSFYMDASSYFMDEGLRADAVRILSNLAELNLENTDVLRALGNKLVEFGMNSLAADVFERLTKIRPELPQFYRDLALASYACGNAQKAVDSLYYVASRAWDSRYDEIQQIALNDMNAIIAVEAAAGRRLDTSRFDKRLMDSFPVDIRVVLTWNTDDCDIDLWVTDPNGEKCYYGHKLTESGGRISRDFTQGYGPEEFCIHNAQKGSYKIEANYFGTHSQKLLQPVVVQAEVYTNFGTPYQKKQLLTLQLETVKGTFTVGSVDF